MIVYIGRYLVVIIVLLFFGCSYRFDVVKSLPRNIERVSIEIFKNNTEELGLEILITNELVKLLTSHLGTATIKHGNDVDAIFCGEVVSLYNENSSHHTSFVNANDRRRLVGTISIFLKNNRGEILWCSGFISAFQEYYIISNDVKLTEYNKKKAIVVLVEKLSTAAFQVLIERF